jgi:ketosteroid isomerase-like protein
VSTAEERLQRLEDQLAIYQLVCGYGYAVDGLNVDAVGTLYAEDGTYEVSDHGVFEGRAAIQAMTQSAGHVELVGSGVAHISTLPYVVIDGDQAAATCHTMLAQHREDGFYIGRLSASRLELERIDGRWHIKRRSNEMLTGKERGPALLGRLMEGPSSQPTIP